MSQLAAVDPIFKVLRLEEAVPVALDGGSQWDVVSSQMEMAGDWSSAWADYSSDYSYDTAMAMSMATSAGSYFPHIPMAGSLLLPDVLPSHADAFMLTNTQLKVKEQVEFYLSDANLCQDAFFNARLAEADDGWLDAKLVLDCARMKRLGATADDLLQALSKGGSTLEITGWLDQCTCEPHVYIRRHGGVPPPPLQGANMGAEPTMHAATPREAEKRCSMESPLSAATTEAPSPNDSSNDREMAVQGGTPTGRDDLQFGDIDSRSPGSSTTLDSSFPPFLLKLSEILPFPETEADSPEEAPTSDGARAGAELLNSLKVEPVKLATSETIAAPGLEAQQRDKVPVPRTPGTKRAKNGQPRLLKRI
jgi:hypothetical protein